MNIDAAVTLIVAFIVSFLAIGLPFWQIPYSQVSLPNSLYDIGLIVTFLAAATCRCLASIRFSSTLLIIGATVPCVILTRVAYEIRLDPTSHNLWPFEVVIATVVGFLVSLVGSLVGAVLCHLFVTKA